MINDITIVKDNVKQTIPLIIFKLGFFTIVHKYNLLFQEGWAFWDTKVTLQSQESDLNQTNL